MSGIQLHYGFLEVQQFEFSSQSLEYQEFVIAVLNCMQCQLNLVLVKHRYQRMPRIKVYIHMYEFMV